MHIQLILITVYLLYKKKEVRIYNHHRNHKCDQHLNHKLVQFLKDK
jgi:hypothetical protein